MAPAVELLEYLLPLLVTAGDYARHVQPDIQGPQPKDADNAWKEAITDADLSVQNFVEVALLARYPEIAFFGEERDYSLNDKYFSPEAGTLVCLDPVNGTFLYRNQRSGWDIVASIVVEGRMVAAVSYTPGSGIFHLAVDGLGALTGCRDNCTVAAMQALATRSGSRVCLTYQANEALQRLRPAFDAFDIIEDDDPGRELDNLNDLFTGRLDAFICRQGDYLDWGATAYIARAAGGRATCLDGTELPVFDRFDPGAVADMLVTSSPAVHDEIMTLLNPQ